MQFDHRRLFPLIDAIAVVWWTLVLLAIVGAIVGAVLGKY